MGGRISAAAGWLVSNSGESDAHDSPLLIHAENHMSAFASCEAFSLYVAFKFPKNVPYPSGSH